MRFSSCSLPISTIAKITYATTMSFLSWSAREGSMLSLIIPVYKNEENLPRLLSELVSLQGRLHSGLEVVFVVDGSPDRSYEVLNETIPSTGLRAQLFSLSRNFGSF